MHERDFFNELTETRTSNLICPKCKFRNDYGVRWVRRTKKESVPNRASERDRALYSKLRSYLVRLDDMVMCKKCRCRFEIPSQRNLVFF